MNIGSALPNLREMVQNRLAELAQKGQKAIESEKDKTNLASTACVMTQAKSPTLSYRLCS